MSNIRVDGAGYVASGGVASGPVQMEFADGEHTICEAIVAHLGGSEALLSRREMFKNKTYKEFITGFWTLVEKSKLNELFQNAIGGHLRGIGT